MGLIVFALTLFVGLSFLINFIFVSYGVTQDNNTVSNIIALFLFCGLVIGVVSGYLVIGWMALLLAMIGLSVPTLVYLIKWTTTSLPSMRNRDDIILQNIVLVVFSLVTAITAGKIGYDKWSLKGFAALFGIALTVVVGIMIKIIIAFKPLPSEVIEVKSK